VTNENLQQALESKLIPGTAYTEQDLTAFSLGVEWAQNEAAKRHDAVLENLRRSAIERADGYIRDAKRFADSKNYATAANFYAHYEAYGMLAVDIQILRGL